MIVNKGWQLTETYFVMYLAPFWFIVPFSQFMHICNLYLHIVYGLYEIDKMLTRNVFMGKLSDIVCLVEMWIVWVLWQCYWYNAGERQRFAACSHTSQSVVTGWIVAGLWSWSRLIWCSRPHACWHCQVLWVLIVSFVYWWSHCQIAFDVQMWSVKVCNIT